MDKAPEIDVSYNITPGLINPVITRNSPNRLEFMKWGLVPFWVKDPKIGYKMINARAEDIEKKPSFRKPIRSQRCLVLTTGFYEWKKMILENKEEKIPFYITLKGQEIFSFAGIYDEWKDAEGYPIKSYAIITTAANKMMGEIHDRMPVILSESDEDIFLDQKTPLEVILKLLKPCSSDTMQAYPVSKDVNSPKNDSKDLLRKINNAI